MNNQSYQGHWRLAEDFPPTDGEYICCFLTKDGEYGWPEPMLFEKGEWLPVMGTDGAAPAYWTQMPMPK